MRNFKEEAKRKGWTLKELAERWGVTPRQMTNVAKNPKQKDWDALESLADFNCRD